MLRIKSLSTGDSWRSHFTLIEILVVIGIMGIMMYVSLPAFEKMLLGSGVDLSARNITSRLGLTRNYAISTRKHIALLMPTSGLPDQYCYGANRLCIVGSTGTYDAGTLVTTYTFQRWVQGESWEFMNIGSAIIHVDNTLGYADPASTLAHEQVEVKRSACSDIGVPNDDPLNLNPFYIRAVIFKPSGKIDCDTFAYGDRYVTLGEGAYASGNLIRKNTDNIINVKIEKYTGRISYGNN